MIKPLAELRSFLAAVRAEYRARRAYAQQLDIEAAQQIADEIAAGQGSAARAAYTAEQADLEAARLLRESLADQRITPDEIPALRSALRHVTNSARADHKVVETLAPS